MVKVSEILKGKRDPLFTGTPDTPISEAVATMSEHDIGSLVIMDRGELVGLVTFREIIRCIHHHAEQGARRSMRSIIDDGRVTVTPKTNDQKGQRRKI